MKILHLFSDWKWTGPAEPTVILCEALEKRGNQVTMAYRRAPGGAGDCIGKRISGRGIHGTDQFQLKPLGKGGKDFGVVDLFRDIVALRRFINREKFDLINVHHSHDHIVAGLATRLLQKKPVLIRTDHRRDAFEPSWRNRLLVSGFTDGILTFSEMAYQRDSRDLPIPVKRVGRVGVALPLERYDPEKPLRNMRSVFNICRNDVVLGMVARFQRYRRTDVFLASLAKLVRDFPHVKALLVGRSSQMQQSVMDPTERLGIVANVVLAGYQTENYLDTIAAMDIFVFLVAGSDGTARALREAMAMGKPVVVARRGILPELVEDGITGLVVDDTPENLFLALRSLIQDRGLREKMGKAGREKALKEFRLDKQAEEVEIFYQKILDMRREKE